MLVFYYYNQFVFHIYSFKKHNIPQKRNLIMIEIILPKISKQTIFLKLIKNLADSFNMGLAKVFGIYQNTF